MTKPVAGFESVAAYIAAAPERTVEELERDIFEIGVAAQRDNVFSEAMLEAAIKALNNKVAAAGSDMGMSKDG